MKILALFFFILCAGCSSDDNDDNSVICTEIFVQGLEVTVKNTATNTVITEGITVIATDGAYSEELINTPSLNSFIGAGERPGDYIIAVTGDGFETYASETITVEKTDDGCHVITEIIEISLNPI